MEIAAAYARFLVSIGDNKAAAQLADDNVSPLPARIPILWQEHRAGAFGAPAGPSSGLVRRPRSGPIRRRQDAAGVDCGGAA